MGDSKGETNNIDGEKEAFLKLNQQTFIELLTFIDFADEKLNIGLVEIKYSTDRDILIQALIEYPECQNIQFVVLNFPAPNIRFLRDELVAALKEIKIEENKKLVLLVTGLEKAIGIVDKYPAVLTNLNFVREDLSKSVPHPILFFLPDYALTRLVKYAPDFWAWSRKVFSFKSDRPNLIKNSNNLIFAENEFFIDNSNLSAKQERLELLLNLLNEYNSVNIEQNQNSLSTIANIYNELGNTYYSLGSYQKAIYYFIKSLEIDRSIKDRNGEAISLNNLGNIYYSLGEYQQAIEYYQQSLAIAQKIGNKNGAAKFFHNLGNTYYSLGEYQRAIEYYQQSLAIAQKIGDKIIESNSLSDLGNIYSALEEYQKAIELYEKSLIITYKIDDNRGKANSLNNIGNIYYSLGKYQRAIISYQQSLEIKQQIGDKQGEANSWFNLGITWNELGQISQAKEAYENAKQLYQEMKLNEDVEDCEEAIRNLDDDKAPQK